MARHGLTDKQVENIIAMRKDNVSYNKISEKYGVSGHTISKICRDNGVDKIDLRYGENNVNWVGGQRKEDRNGYVNIYVPQTHPFYQAMKTRRGTIMEHRMMMAEHLGRPLLSSEDVHHKNGIRNDNRINNFELWVTKQPRGQRVEDVVDYAIEILSLYAPERLT